MVAVLTLVLPQLEVDCLDVVLQGRGGAAPVNTETDDDELL